MERTSFEQRRTDLPRFLNPTKHFPKYQTIEATSLFFILKTQKLKFFCGIIWKHKTKQFDKLKTTNYEQNELFQDEER